EHWGLPSLEQSENMRKELDENHPHLLVTTDPGIVKRFIEGYKKDISFRNRYMETVHNPVKELTPSHFHKADNRLLYFTNADWQLRLCVPASMVTYILNWVHSSPFEGAHEG
ncbi:hypothetical protein ARMSODRAFT_855517, partial [Armillaria solidipes]